MDFQKLVQDARTCRRFIEKQKIEIDTLKWLIDCARIAPCARNSQSLRYVIAESKEACQAIFPNTRWAGILKWNGPEEGERASGYIAILMPKNAGKFIHMDVGVAAQTMQLAAKTKGIGCCMIGLFKPEPCEKIFKVPEDMEIALVLGFGFEKEIRVLTDMPNDGTFAFWRDENQVHYVPKRPLEEVILHIL